MKKTIILGLFAASVSVTAASAQSTKPADSTKTFSIADSANFTGRYKYEGMPFEYMVITAKDGKLNFSGGEYGGPLTPVAGKKDVFDANGQAVFSFVRNADNKITDLAIDYQGQQFSGKKEEKKAP